MKQQQEKKKGEEPLTREAALGIHETTSEELELASTPPSRKPPIEKHWEVHWPELAADWSHQLSGLRPTSTMHHWPLHHVQRIPFTSKNKPYPRDTTRRVRCCWETARKSHRRSKVQKKDRLWFFHSNDQSCYQPRRHVQELPWNASHYPTLSSAAISPRSHQKIAE